VRQSAGAVLRQSAGAVLVRRQRLPTEWQAPAAD